MTPAMPIGPRVGDTRVSWSASPLDVVRASRALAVGRAPDDDPAVVDAAASKVWIGLPSSTMTYSRRPTRC
jgi:hypothetical protein